MKNYPDIFSFENSVDQGHLTSSADHGLNCFSPILILPDLGFSVQSKDGIIEMTILRLIDSFFTCKSLLMLHLNSDLQ